MSFINSALIQKLTQQVEELTQRVVVLEGGSLKATGEASVASEEATNRLAKGSTKEPLEGV